MDYVCKACGAENALKMSVEGTRVRLSCSECGGFIKWVGEKEMHVLQQLGVPLDSTKTGLCPHCGCSETVERPSGPHIGKYCKKCGTFICWVKKKKH